MGNEVGLMQNQQNVNRKSKFTFPSPMGNEVGLMYGHEGHYYDVTKFPSPMGNEVGLISRENKLLEAEESFRPLWGMR